jgi:asparagine synthase (glutamine-hydrolysing)
MCGICGQFNFKNNEPVIPEVIKRMTKTLVHRGPDDEGYYISGPIGLGFRRLSIIDLDGGHQPMWDREKSVCVIFNGEIYNFPDLRMELENYGHVFQRNSDTEVIVHGYKQWGTEVFNHLNGMFGLAIWDANAKQLILARDPFGIKFVYYKVDSYGVYFASEVRAIRASNGHKPDVDPVALNLFLRYRYTPSPLTLFKGIKKLAAGTMAVFKKGEMHIERWYKFKPAHLSPMPSADEAKEELLSIYKRAVNRHLISDVPVGLLLSGGVDSGLLLGLMNLERNSWPTFTVGYGQSFKDDELVDASRTAKIFSSNHTSVELNRHTFEKALPKIVSSLEEPIASSSIVPMYFVCERARRDVKVALVGQGPDELFGGYRRHIGVRYGSYWRSLPKWAQASIASVVNTLPRYESLKRGVYSLNISDRVNRYQNVFSIMPGEKINELFHDGLIPLDAGDQILYCWNGLIPLMEYTDELGGLQFLEIRSSLPDELLMYGDKLSMAHGLEVRVPYLDRELVEYVESLHSHFKVRNGSGKWLHRKVCNDFLPREIIKREKRGFAVKVVDDWFNRSFSGKMKSYLSDNSSLMFQILNPLVVHRLLDEHRSGKDDNHKILFSLVVFEEWLRVMSIGHVS